MFVTLSRHYVWLTVVMAWGAACSFQDFDYLQNAAESTSIGSSGGSGGSTTGGGGSLSGSNGGSGGSTATNSGDSGTTGGGTGGAMSSMTNGNSIGGMGGDDGSPTTMGMAGAAGAFGGDNILTNPSFEEGWTGWLVDPEASRNNHVRVKWPQPGSVTPNGQSEEFLLGSWHDADAYVLSVFQAVDDLEDGSYGLIGYFNWGGAVNSVRMFARNCGGDDVYQDVQPTADTQWREVIITDIQVAGGQCEVGLEIDSNPGGWLNADMFSFFEMDPR